MSLTVFAAMCVIVLFFADTFEKILSFTIFLDSFGMAFSAATIFILRKRTKHLDGTGIYTMKFFPLMPVIFIAAYIFVAASIADQHTTICSDRYWVNYTFYANLFFYPWNEKTNYVRWIFPIY